MFPEIDPAARRAAGERPAFSGDALERLLPSLTGLLPGDPAAFAARLAATLAAGGVPFEVIAGAPAASFGARITLQPAGDPRALAAAAGLADPRAPHPWGPPDWVGLRMAADGAVAAKPYHRVAVLDDRFHLPAGAPSGLVPVMAAQQGDQVELYLRRRPATGWPAFAAACARLIGADRPEAEPLPRPAELGFCVSFAWRAGELTAVTLYADSRCLGDDESVGRAWSRGLEELDRESYRRALAAVRSLGRLRGRAWHSMLAWKLGADGTRGRAVSLRVPPPARVPHPAGR